jgi:uncharacterized membrane protein
MPALTAEQLGLVATAFVAAAVEFVEASTIVLAMALTRDPRSALAGTLAGIATLALVTLLAGIALVQWFPESLLKLVVGFLLLVFGLQWLRKAILRSSGVQALRDEDARYAAEAEVARRAVSGSVFGLDWFAFVVSFKGVFLEGVEVVFIVITFGLNADNVGLAAAGAAGAGVIVLTVGAIAHKPLAAVPENTLKYGVGLLLATFGTFWAVEGLGVFQPGGESMEWPGSDWALLPLLAGWFILSQLLVRAAPALARRGDPTPPVSAPVVAEEVS